MPDMDKVPDELEAAVTQITDAARRALIAVYGYGMRDGLSTASQYLGGVSDELRQRPNAADMRELIEVFDKVRDNLQLGAYNVPTTPEEGK